MEQRIKDPIYFALSAERNEEDLTSEHFFHHVLGLSNLKSSKLWHYNLNSVERRSS